LSAKAEVGKSTLFHVIRGWDAKGAVMALTRSMARESGDFNIRVSTIAPGFTHSEGGDQFDRSKALPLPPLDELELVSEIVYEFIRNIVLQRLSFETIMR